MPLVTTQVKIAASPEEVRAKVRRDINVEYSFLDFSQLPNYSPTGFIRSIVPAVPKDPSEIKPRDVLKVSVGYGKFNINPTVLENSPSVFTWRGSLLGIFVGDHSFRFEESKTETGTATLFKHEENFSGILAFVMGDGYLARWVGEKEKTQKGFESFNRDFKTWVEAK